MYIARILYPVRVLGPGKRVGIWFAGCKHRCKGCSNPELWEFEEKYRTSIGVIMRLINSIGEKDEIEGFTITGGDPFEQPDSLNILLDEIRKINDDIIVYTGYEFKELPTSIVAKTAVIIDGKYIEEQNHETALKGSDNQNIIIVDNKYQNKYEQYLQAAKSEIQNFATGNSVISVGIHKPGFDFELRKRIKTKGLEEA